MNKWKMAVQKLLKPNALIIALTFIFTPALIALSLYLVIANIMNVLSYVSYALSALALTYAVYIIVLLAPKIKARIISGLKKHAFTARMLDSFGYRKFVFAAFSFTLNILYALSHAVFAVLSRSIWLGALATYYIALSLIRGGAVKICGDNRAYDKEHSHVREIKSYRNCGVYLLLLNLALVGALVQMVIENKGFMYAGYLIYVMAAYTFYKLSFSIKDFIKLRKDKNYAVKTVTYIGLITSLVSLYALQTAMFAAFGGGVDVRLPNALMGGAVTISIIALGIFMIIKGNKALTTMKENDTNE